MKRYVLAFTIALWGCENFEQLAQNAKCDGGFGCDGETGGGSATGGGGSTTGGGSGTTGGGSATGGGSTSGGGTATGGGSALGGGTATGGGSPTGGGSATGGGSPTGGGSAVGGGTATTGGGSATGGGTGAPACPTIDGGWTVFFPPDGGVAGSSGETQPWGLTTVDCNVYVLLLNHPASNRDTAELLTYSSTGTRISALTLGDSFNDTADRGAYRLASLDHTLVATYPTNDGGGQLVVFDVSDAGPTEVKRASTPFSPQTLTLAPNIAHLFGRSGSQFIYSQGVLSTTPLLIGPVGATTCPGINVERAVYAPDGFVIFTGVQQASGACSVGSFSSDAGNVVFVAEVPPGGTTITGTRIVGAQTAEFSDTSVAAKDTVWVTYATSSGASVSQVNRTGTAQSFTVSLSNTTNSGDFHTLPGDLAFWPDGGLELVGTVTPPAGSFVGVPITPDAGDYDAFILHFMNGSATNVQTFGTGATDGFTHVVPFGQQEIVLGLSATYSSAETMKAFMMCLSR